MKILLPARRALGEWGGRRPERHQRAKMVVVKTPSKGKPSIGKSIRNLSTVTRVCGQKWVNAYPLPGEEWPLVSAFFRSRDQAGSPLGMGLSRSLSPREWPLFALCCGSYNALCITIAAIPSRIKSVLLAERFLRSKAVLYKEDTSGLVRKTPARELLTACDASAAAKEIHPLSEKSRALASAAVEREAAFPIPPRSIDDNRRGTSPQSATGGG
jgi:hypothetical protein